MTQPAINVVMPNQIHGIETPQRKKAMQLRDQYVAQVDSVMANSDFSDDAKRRMIADSWATTQAQLQALATEEEQAFATRRTDLQRGLFGEPDTNFGDRLVAIRDASDRAGRLESDDEATAAFDRAQQLGDTMLSKAIANAAVERGWQSTLDRFTSANPNAEAALNEIAGIDQQQTVQAKMGAAFTYGLPKPSNVDQFTLRQAALEHGIRF